MVDRIDADRLGHRFNLTSKLLRRPPRRHCAAWAGVCPGNNESAGKRRMARRPPGQRRPPRDPNRMRSRCRAHQTLPVQGIPQGPDRTPGPHAQPSPPRTRSCASSIPCCAPGGRTTIPKRTTRPSWSSATRPAGPRCSRGMAIRYRPHRKWPPPHRSGRSPYHTLERVPPGNRA